MLVSSYDPLRVYIFEEGLVRFATHKYTTKLKEVKKRFIHLTNFSVNKHSKMFVKNKEADEDGQGSKWSLTALKSYYQSIGVDSVTVMLLLYSAVRTHQRNHRKNVHSCRADDA